MGYERFDNGLIMKMGDGLRALAPLTHCITSPIAINDCANAVLAAGARPIMAEHPAEAAGITGMTAALGVSLANITDARRESIMISGRKAYESGICSVIDVVGVGVSPLRMELAQRFIEECRPVVIKGNASEIRALAGAAHGESGIDTAESDRVSRKKAGSVEALAGVTRELSLKTGAVVLASGAIDVISDGYSGADLHSNDLPDTGTAHTGSGHAGATYIVENGAPEMSGVTGTGCILNCLTAAFLALVPGKGKNAAGAHVENSGSHVQKSDGYEYTPLHAALYATALLGIAGELADKSRGLGTYHIGLIDEISLLTSDTFSQMAKIYRL